jgi:hypothetical protein
MDFDKIINRFQQLASTRGGAVLTIIVLIFTAAFASGILGQTMGFITIEGTYKNLFVIFIFIYFMLLAMVIFKILRQNPKIESEVVGHIQSSSTISNKKGITSKSINLERLSSYIIAVSISTLVIVIYAFGCLSIIKDLLIPTIQNISTTPFEWDTKYLIDNIILPLIMVIMWITMPFFFYLESRKKGKR